MKKKPDHMLTLVALAGLVVAGIVTTAIINAVKNNQGATDVRAKAGTTSTLKLTGTVSTVNDSDGTIVVSNVQFAPESRSGKPVNYGTWTVTPPAAFSLSKAVPGSRIVFTVQSTALNVALRSVVAAQISIGK